MDHSGAQRAIRTPFQACVPRTLEYEHWLRLGLPGCYASLLGRDIQIIPCVVASRSDWQGSRPGVTKIPRGSSLEQALYRPTTGGST
jgi:hypothetical protein